MRPPHITLCPLRLQDAEAILSWRYSPPYDVYNFDPASAATDLRYLLNPVNNFHAILDADGVIVGFCSFGSDGQVPGGDYEAVALDIGMGIRPDLTGQGYGAAYARVVMAYGTERYGFSRARVTIASFNLRARKVWKRLGFAPVSEFVHAGSGRRFVILMAETNGRSGVQDEVERT